MRRHCPNATFVLSLLLHACTSSPAASDAAQDAGLDAASDQDAFVVVDAPMRDAGPPPPPPSEPGRHNVVVSESRRIVPSAGLPPEAVAQTSNNNLDVIRFGGRVYLVFRTGPFHFASPDVQIHVVSSTDEITWQYEHTYTRATDLREPRFLAVGDELVLYLAELGTNRFDFEPMRTLSGTRAADGTWGTLTTVSGLENAIVWRARVERGTPYLITYFHGEQIYDFIPNPTMPIDLLTTTDGIHITPFDPAHRTLYTGGASETDFSIGDDGRLFGVMRLEAGDEVSGFGSRICHAEPGHLAEWSCVTDPRKYDSPLAFFHDGEHYLVGRRNVTATGNYDLMGRGNFVQRQVANQIDYIERPKRCSLWRHVPEENRIAFVLDLPSRGDTCFASMLEGASANEVVIYNYTSDPDGPDVAWNVGQEGPTFIYRHVLRFDPR